MANLSVVRIYVQMTEITPKALIQRLKDEEKTVGQLAKEAGLLYRLKHKIIENVSEKLNSMVENGRLTQQKADEIIQSVTDRVNNCSADRPGNFNDMRRLPPMRKKFKRK